MKAVFLICATLVVLAVIGQSRADAECDSGENYSCSRKCYETEGRHGDCNTVGRCVCSDCIYQGCKAICRRQGIRIAQCWGERCICMG